MPRILQGCLGLLVGFFVLLLALILWRWQSTKDFVANIQDVLEEPQWAEGMDTPRGILDYIDSHREDVSLIATTLDGDGGLLEEAQGVFLNADLPRSLGSAIHLVHILALSESIVAGEHRGDERIPISHWDAFHLYGMDGGAHLLAKRELDEAARTEGHISLDGLVRATLRHTDPAAGDLLLDRLHRSHRKQAEEFLGLDGPALPWLGMFLLARNHEHPNEDTARLESLLGAGAYALEGQVAERLARWAEPDWRNEEEHWRRHDMSMGTLRYQSRWSEELMPQTSARALAKSMAELTHASARPGLLEAKMRLAAKGQVANHYKMLITVPGMLPAMVAELTYAEPTDGDFAGQRRVVILLMRAMPMAAWLRLMETRAQQVFTLRMATRSGFEDLVRRRLQAPPTPPDSKHTTDPGTDREGTTLLDEN